jgi:hypothetical protein
MSRNSRRRHAQKQRRARSRPERNQPRAEQRATVDAWLLLAHFVQGAVNGIAPPRARQAFAEQPVRDQQHALEAEYRHAVTHLIGGGWTPFDFFEIARRKAAPLPTEYLLATVAGCTAEHSAARVHPRWRAQLDQLDANPVRTLADWATQRARPWPDLAEQLVELLVVLAGLPKVHPVLPPPGADPQPDAFHAAIDDKVLRRVRALLAKAESTEFEEEAEALSAKAQSLMTRYAIERTLAEAPHASAAKPAVRRIWLDQPYLTAKAVLVSAVADANHCRAVRDPLGFVDLIGFDTDLDVVELLSTSLLVQATRAMQLTGTHTTRHGTSRTTSFRRSFLIAYAYRIGERLRESADCAETEADRQHGGALVPVLRARDDVVDDAFAAAFPHTVSRPMQVSNAAGWSAGRAAADLARFDVRDAVPGHRSAAS